MGYKCPLLLTMLMRNILVILHNISLSGDMMFQNLLYKSILAKTGYRVLF